MDVRTLLRRAASYFKDREAVIFKDKRLSFAEAWARGVRLANALNKLGVQQGDRVAVLENNGIAAVDAFIGLALGSYVRCPLYARNSISAHLSMLQRGECKALLAGPEFAAEIEGLKVQMPALEHVLLRDGDYESWLAAQSDVDPDPEISPDDLFALRFTGGTTGLPKGIPNTHWQFLSQCRDWFYAFPTVEPHDSVLHVAPITHASGSLFLPAWAAGARNVLVDQFNPVEVLDLFEQESISFLFLPPTVINALSRHPSAPGRDYSALKVLMSASAPIASETTRRARKVFGDVLYQGYGLSEVFPLTMMGPSQWFANVAGSRPIESAGRPLPFTDIEIWGEDDKPLPPGSAGEIVVRSDGQMDAYWNDPEQTAERMSGGWIRTGDVGKIDENGYLYILDRKADMIISGGFNIYPAELENVIAGHPGVIEVAVFAVPHEKWGETPMVVAVVEDVEKMDEQEVIELVSAKLGSYKKPGIVRFTTEPLPKTPVGKINRKALRDSERGEGNLHVAGA